ncbi:hypothetical protein LPW11_03395 [Geomonas sp. RF6]|uniref:hypothetical protein n=1 Tax=Geomonas sp. RF6 TaxID=2897342 RepID=UPI001E3A63DF|nr:hypothetical protein [Geomonas sp. RF6]UFS71244.1 hypothetical protein LPW11_03395 [Geomonas sp. RF6]
MRKRIFAAMALIAGCAVASTASADVTGDFKVTGYSYANDVASVSGTVNHGAIQSKKTVNVDVTYEYSFVAEKTETIPGETTTVTIFTPGKCTTTTYATADNTTKNACWDNNGKPKAIKGEIWTGSYETSTTTTEPRTVTYKFNGSQGMTAITEPTIEKGRLNPKGKITGYNWTGTESIVPNADLVDPALIPAGYTVVSVTVNEITYKAYLTDSTGAEIADTVMTGTIPVQ